MLKVTLKWQECYPSAMKSCLVNWDVIIPIFKFSADVRKLYTRLMLLKVLVVLIID